MTLSDYLDLEAKQGDTFSLAFAYQEDDGTPIDVTGYTAEFSLAVAPGGSPSFTYTDDDYITVGTTDGLFTVSIPPAQTRLWEHRRYSYEITVVDTSDVKTTLFEGKLSIRPEVVLD